MVLLTEIPQQSSSSSSSSSTYCYDVFLSFRGTDTRCNFTDHLHNALLDANIQTFLDDAEIQTGEELKPELEAAIRSSRVSIIVLSKDYASSTWCLDELVLILEQRKNFNQIVIPVFYHVEPTHVRKQQNTFGDAMTKHKQRMDAEKNSYKKSQWARKIEKWEEALTLVADIKGEEANGRRESILIKDIIKEISRRLDLPKQGMIPKVIGMEYQKRIIASFLKDESSQTAEILTIWGMAGIGKTCLAEYMFQLHYCDFERSCFLQDIERRCASPNGLLGLQKQLLKDIHYESWMDIQNTNVGTFKIVESLPRKRTLLVLDDVSKVEHLDMFIGIKGLHPGSKIIVTSKNESLTEYWLFQTQAPLKHTKQAHEALHEYESLQLLCFHAFGRIDPDECEKEEPRKVVRYCQGHPLALKVLGSSLRNNDTTWEDILESLGKEINPEIKRILQISIDYLPNKTDRDVFVHIACFFIGKDRYFVEEILKACDICKLSTIKNLSKRCLIRIKENNLYMHQLLQDIGRDMVEQESPDPWNRSLLWNHEDCFDVLQKRKGTSRIKGLVFDMNTFEDGTFSGSDLFRSRTTLFHMFHLLLSVICWLLGWDYRLHSSLPRQKNGFHTHAFGDMCNLKILKLNYVQLHGSYKNFPEGLRWLCMHGFSFSYLPSDLTMEHMVSLDMSNSNLKQLWKKPKFLRSLKFLNMSFCRELVSVGSFCGLPSLERLILTRCTSLVELCESIGGYCDRLEVLDLSECNKLKRLPRSLEKLKKLTKLSLNGCSMESLQAVVSNNFNKESQLSFSTVNINNKVEMPRSYMPFVILLPSSLVHLSLNDNNLSNSSFPKSFKGLSMLKTLDLDGNQIDSLPEFVRSLNRLERLGVSRCSKLTTLLCVPSTIKELGTECCTSLKRISFYPGISTSPTIDCHGLFSLIEVEGMSKVEGIAEIEEEILDSLPWINIKDVKDSKRRFHDAHVSPLLRHYHREIRNLEIIYEKGVFSKFFEGKELPYWITHRSKGNTPTISISIPLSCPNNFRIQGLNVCFSLTFSKDNRLMPFVIIKNLTKNCFWRYLPVCYLKFEAKVGKEGINIIWLSHCIFGNNEFEDGDEVGVFYENRFYIKEDPVKEFGISFVYEKRNKKEDPFGSLRVAPMETHGFSRSLTFIHL